MIRFRNMFVGLCALLALSLAGAAQAASVLALDFNNLTAQAQDSGGNNTAFGGVTHTGKLVLSKGAGVLAGINVDGSPSALFTGSLTGFSGTILLNNGTVTGGSMTATVTNPDTSVDTYSFSIVNGSGFVADPSNQGVQFFVGGLTANGVFNDANFGGVPVADFPGNQLTGTFFQFKLDPDSRGLDASTDLDVTVNAPQPNPNPIPLPAAVWGGMALLGGLISGKIIRRRKQD